MFSDATAEEAEIVRASKTRYFSVKMTISPNREHLPSYVLFIIEWICEHIWSGVMDNIKKLQFAELSNQVNLSDFSVVFSEKYFNYSSVALTDCHVFLLKKKLLLKVVTKTGCSHSTLLKIL